MDSSTGHSPSPPPDQDGEVVVRDEINEDYSSLENLCAALERVRTSAGDSINAFRVNKFQPFIRNDPVGYMSLVLSMNGIAQTFTKQFGGGQHRLATLQRYSAVASMITTTLAIIMTAPELYAAAKSLSLAARAAQADDDPVEDAAESVVPSPTEASDEEGDGTTQSDGAPEFSITATQDTASVDETIEDIHRLWIEEEPEASIAPTDSSATLDKPLATNGSSASSFSGASNGE